MNTTELFNKQILMQVQKDGKSYPELNRRMATVLLEGLPKEEEPNLLGASFAEYVASTARNLSIGNIMTVEVGDWSFVLERTK